MSGTKVSKTEKSNRPKDDPFHQHQLCGIHIFLDSKHTFPLLLIIGILFICIGIWLKTEIDTIQENYVDYTDCISLNNSNKTCSEELNNSTMTNYYLSCYCVINFNISSTFKGNVNFYYKLTNFYQNYKSYVTSKDDMQLNGKGPPFKSSCDPYLTNSLNQNYAPCGAISNSLFNDTFQLYYISTNTTILVPWSNVNISWQTDRDELFGKPSSFNNTAKPVNWKYSASERNVNSYKGDEELIVWMRVAAFPSFRKLHRKLILTDSFSQGLVQGNYSLYINYSFPVSPFSGTKGFIITTPHWLDSKDPAIFIIFIICGICHLIGFAVLIAILQCRKNNRKEID